VFYEMLSGRTVFLRNSTAETVASILKEEPPSLSGSGTTLPVELERAIRRCLEKTPEARFQSASDLAYNLRSISTDQVIRPVTTPKLKKRPWVKRAVAVAAVAVMAVIGWELVDLQPAPAIPEVKHIAVLPFEAAGDDSESRFLAAGLAETVTDGLRIMERETRGEVWVIPPSPDLTLEYARKKHNATIGIRGIFNGTTERVRLDLELMDITSGRPLDSRVLDESVGNLTALQNVPVQMVWEMLGLEATPEAAEDLEKLSTNTGPACRTYVTGRGRLSMADDAEELQAAAASLEQTVAEDPGFAPARVALARAFARLFDETHENRWKERALEEAEYAAGLDNDSAEPYLVLGSVYEAAGDNGSRLRALRRATAVSGTADAYVALGRAATHAELFDEAETAYQTAINLRPDHFYSHHRLGHLYTEMGRYDAAANEYRYATRAAPANVDGYINLGAILYFQGLRDEARGAFEDAIAAEPNVVAYSNLGTLSFEEARFGDAAEMFEKAVEVVGDELRPHQYFLVGNLASSLYWSGERDRAQVNYQRAIELAEEHLARHPEDIDAMADLAGYHGVSGQNDRGIELLEAIIEGDIRDVYFMATIAESFEDLGDRERALAWLGAALDGGLAVDYVERRPSFNRLRGDNRFKSMLEKHEVE
jgi:tetratricopeptide (TPR) repeat protein/TolB-like protein